MKSIHSYFCFSLLALTIPLFSVNAYAQEHQGCFLIPQSGNLVDLNSLCRGNAVTESEISPTFQELYNYGLQQGRDGSYEAAINTFTQVIQIAPNEPVSFLARASAYLAINNLHNALSDYERAIQLLRNRGDLEIADAIERSLESLRNSP